MNDLISIIIPIYKSEKTIHKCVDSIINQTYDNIEIILVDDESPDKCGEICDTYANLDKRIKVIHKKNGGVSDARNEGLKIATGKYIGFIDSDDFIKNDMYEILYKNILNYNANISICNIIKIKNNTSECIENYKEKEIYDKNNSLEQLLKGHIENYTVNKLYEKKLWENIYFPSGKLLEDMDVMYKVIEKSQRIVCTNKTEYYYVIREDSLISRIDAKVTNDLRNIVNKRYEYIKLNRLDLLEQLTSSKLMSIFQYHYNLSYCKEKELYNTDKFLEEYKFYKKNFIKHKKEIMEKKSTIKKFEFYLLYINRTLYYHYNKIKVIIKYYIKKVK